MKIIRKIFSPYLISFLLGAISVYLLMNYQEGLKVQIAKKYLIMQLGIITHDVYKTGNYEASKILLNFTINLLKSIQNEDVIFENDLSIAYGRLGYIEEKKNNIDLATQNYEEALRIFHKKNPNFTIDDVRKYVIKIEN